MTMTIHAPGLTYQQRAILRRSFSILARNHQELALLFGDKLFELDPGLRALFKINFRQQQRKLTRALAFIARLLEQPEMLYDDLQALSQQYLRVGVEDQDYVVFGTALLWAIERTLGDAYTPDVRDAWESLWDLIEAVMTIPQAA